MIFAQSLFAFLMPEQASTAAERVDRLLYFLVAVTGTMAVLIAAVIVFFSVKYRRRPGNVQTPKVKSAAALEIFWTVVPLVIFLVIFVWSASIYFYMTRSPAGIPEIYVVGKQWMWKIQHPEGQREINALHVPVGQPVRAHADLRGRDPRLLRARLPHQDGRAARPLRLHLVPGHEDRHVPLLLLAVLRHGPLGR